MLTTKGHALVGTAVLILAAAGCSQQGTETGSAEVGTAESGGVAAANAAAAHSGVLEGMVTAASGEPVAGAFVKLKNEARRLTIMVVSQEGGRYTAAQLPAGNYMVQSVGGGFQSEWSSPIQVSNDGAAQADLTLAVARAPDLAPAWTRRMPENQTSMDMLPEHRAKDLINARCVACHTAWPIVVRRNTPGSWSGIVESMRENMASIGMPGLTDDEAETISDYLAENLPPLPAPDANSRFPRELVQGEARNYRVVQYDLENAGAETHDVAVDPWGVGWANQRLGGMISRFDPVNYEYSEIAPPLQSAARARPGNLQISRDGVMWIPESAEANWMSYDIAADSWHAWAFPEDLRGPVQGNTLTLPPDGSVWMSGQGAARRLDPATGEWNSWDSPSWTQTKLNPGGYGMTYDGNGRIWMAEDNVDRIARFDGKTGEVVEFEIPSDEVDYPRRMDHDPNGDVWVGLWSSGKILKIDHNTGEMTIIEPPVPGNGVYSIDFDETNGYMWATFHKADIIARYNPQSEEWLLLPMPQSETDARRVEVDQHNPSRVWWSSVAYQARIGYTELLE